MNIWKNKKVLITGHTGFKGSWLSIWLKNKEANVSGISLKTKVSNPHLFSILNLKNDVNDFRGDISSLNYCIKKIKQIKPEIIFHMAAQPLVRASYKQPILTYNTNVMGTANILEVTKICDSVKALIVVTSDKCYENIEQNYSYIESDRLGGYDPYSSSKACAEHITSAYYHSFLKEKNVGVATARAGNVIGGGDWSIDRLVPDTIKSWSNNEKVVIRYPNAIRPWQHVLEPLSGYMAIGQKLLENPRRFSTSYNFGPSRKSEKTVEDTVSQLATDWGGNPKIEFSNSSNLHEAKLLQLNSEKSKKLLDWKPYLNFEETISKTVKWYKKYYSGSNEMRMLTLEQIKKYEKISDNAKSK